MTRATGSRPQTDPVLFLITKPVREYNPGKAQENRPKVRTKQMESAKSEVKGRQRFSPEHVRSIRSRLFSRQYGQRVPYEFTTAGGSEPLQERILR